MQNTALLLGLLIAAVPLAVLVYYAFSDAQTGRLLLIGVLPFLLILAASVGVGLTYVSAKFSAADAGEVMFSVATILLVSMTVGIFLRLSCGGIQPYEQFVGTVTDVSGEEMAQLLADITTTEHDVCELITRTDKFIQSDVGKAGYDNPALVAQAREKAREAVNGPLTDCQTVWPDVSGEAALNEADNRMSRMEATLKSFTGPELESTYNRTVPCQEGFASQIDAARARLTAIQATIQMQKTKYLKPIDDKNAALQRGEVSDCDKKRGAKVAVTASVTGKTPNKG